MEKKINPSDWVKTILLESSKFGARLFRQQVGFGWTADPSKTIKVKIAGPVMCQPGDIVLRQGRPFVTGVKGMSDTGGWISVIVTPDMVGKRIAQHVAIEAKTGSGRLTEEQGNYIEAVLASGGRAGVARTVEDVKRILGE